MAGKTWRWAWMIFLLVILTGYLVFWHYNSVPISQAYTALKLKDLARTSTVGSGARRPNDKNVETVETGKLSPTATARKSIKSSNASPSDNSAHDRNSSSYSKAQYTKSCNKETQGTKSDDNKVPKCTNPDRLATLHSTCETLKAQNSAPKAPLWLINSKETLYNMTDKELRKVVGSIISDDKHKVLYCAIPKTGCTSWKYHFVKNADEYLNTNRSQAGAKVHVHVTEELQQFGLVPLRSMSRSDIFLRLDNYFTMINVQHPLDRLVSTYNEKFVKRNRQYQYGVGRKIIKRYRNKPLNDSLVSGVGVTFSEFLHWVRDRSITSSSMDPHWENFLKSCFPCLIRYDYIAKLETSADDLDFIVNQKLSQNLVPDVMNNQRGGGYSFQDGVKVLQKYSEVPQKLFQDVLQYYRADMELFGYSAWRDVTKGSVLARCGQAEGGCC